MDIQVSIAPILGNLALVISVVVLIRELRENNRLCRAANSQSLVVIASPFYLGLIQDRGMAELFVRSHRDFDKLDEVDRRRCRILLTWWLIFHENIYYQWRQGLLDRQAFLPWWRDLCLFLRQCDLPSHWDGLKDQFQEEFAGHVTELLDAIARGAAVTPPA